MKPDKEPQLLVLDSRKEIWYPTLEAPQGWKQSHTSNKWNKQYKTLKSTEEGKYYLTRHSCLSMKLYKEDQ